MTGAQSLQPIQGAVGAENEFIAAKKSAKAGRVLLAGRKVLASTKKSVNGRASDVVRLAASIDLSASTDSKPASGLVLSVRRLARARHGL